MPTAVTVTGVALAAIGGYAFSRFKFVGRKATMLAILTTQMFPATMLMLPLYVLMKNLHLLVTFAGLVVAYTATALHFCVWTMRGYYDTIPCELEQAALIDGCTPWQAFVKVTLPLAAPALSLLSVSAPNVIPARRSDRAAASPSSAR